MNEMALTIDRNVFFPLAGYLSRCSVSMCQGRLISKNTMIEQEDFQKILAKSGWRIIPYMGAMEAFFEKANGNST
jgi:hypothetical protein